MVPLPVKFLSGPNRATFRAADGALYVAGSTGWQTSAVKDGALQRLTHLSRLLDDRILDRANWRGLNLLGEAHALARRHLAA